MALSDERQNHPRPSRWVAKSKITLVRPTIVRHVGTSRHPNHAKQLEDEQHSHTQSSLGRPNSQMAASPAWAANPSPTPLHAYLPTYTASRIYLPTPTPPHTLAHKHPHPHPHKHPHSQRHPERSGHPDATLRPMQLPPHGDHHTDIVVSAHGEIACNSND